MAQIVQSHGAAIHPQAQFKHRTTTAHKPDADGVTTHEWESFFDQFEPQEFVQLYEVSRPVKKTNR